MDKMVLRCRTRIRNAAVRIKIEVADAETRLSELIDSPGGGGEILIVREGLPVARLVSVEDAGPDRVPGSAKGLFVVPDDFDAPVDELREYM
jgi:prevent-host-death family protein